MNLGAASPSRPYFESRTPVRYFTLQRYKEFSEKQNNR